MKSKIIFLMGLIMLLLGILFSIKSVIMIVIGIMGGGLIGYSSNTMLRNKKS